MSCTNVLRRTAWALSAGCGLTLGVAVIAGAGREGAQDSPEKIRTDRVASQLARPSNGPLNAYLQTNLVSNLLELQP